MTTFLHLTDRAGEMLLVNVAAISAVCAVPNRAPAVQAAVSLIGDIRSPLLVQETIEEIDVMLEADELAASTTP